MDRHIIHVDGKIKNHGIFRYPISIICSNLIHSACSMCFALSFRLFRSTSSWVPLGVLLACPPHTHTHTWKKKQSRVRRNNLQKILGVAELLYSARPSETRKWEWYGMVNKKKMPYFQPNLQCRANLYLQWFPHGRRPELNIGTPYSNHSNPVRWNPQT